MGASGPFVQIEAGPGAVLTGLVRRTDGVTAFAVEQTELDKIAEEVAGRA
jgi:hypothetical protein